MKLIIAGSRSAVLSTAVSLIDEHLSNNHPSEVVSGGARGADAAGEKWALTRNIPIRRFLANWRDPESPTFDPIKGYDPIAGHARNIQMAEYADALLALWDGRSPGTKHMIAEMKRRNKPVTVITITHAPTLHLTRLISRAEHDRNMRNCNPHYQNRRLNDPQKTKAIQQILNHRNPDRVSQKKLVNPPDKHKINNLQHTPPPDS